MIKIIFKIISIIILILAIAIFYLSFFGIKTDKFNKQINNNILKINKRINLSLGEVRYLLNPYNFAINIQSINPQILIKSRSLGIKKIQTNVTLKSLINGQFLIDDLEIITKEIKVNDIITLLRVFDNSTQLFVLNTIIKDGFVTANINLNFDEKGNIKNNYKIEGSVKKVKMNILNQFKLHNLNFNFNFDRTIFSLKMIDMKLNNIKITSPLVDIKKDKNSFFVNGQFLNDNFFFDTDEFKKIFPNLFNEMDIQKIEFSSKNNLSFNVNKSLKFDNFKIESIIDLNQIIINPKNLNLKTYFPSFIDEIKLEKHKIIINYNKNKFKIKGNGKILLEDKLDDLSYQIIKDNMKISFDTKINLKNNSLLIDFLDYEKKEGLSSFVTIKGNLKKNNLLRLDLIKVKAKNNIILIKGLDLNKDYKIIDIKNFNIDYINNKKILNKLNLKKDKSNFIIVGESLDASRIINNIIDGDNEDSFIFQNLDSKINIQIKKT